MPCQRRLGAQLSECSDTHQQRQPGTHRAGRPSSCAARAPGTQHVVGIALDCRRFMWPAARTLPVKSGSSEAGRKSDGCHSLSEVLSRGATCTAGRRLANCPRVVRVCTCTYVVLDVVTHALDDFEPLAREAVKHLAVQDNWTALGGCNGTSSSGFSHQPAAPGLGGGQSCHDAACANSDSAIKVVRFQEVQGATRRNMHLSASPQPCCKEPYEVLQVRGSVQLSAKSAKVGCAAVDARGTGGRFLYRHRCWCIYRASSSVAAHRCWSVHHRASEGRGLPSHSHRQISPVSGICHATARRASSLTRLTHSDVAGAGVADGSKEMGQGAPVHALVICD
jgi:hypothetical protein